MRKPIIYCCLAATAALIAGCGGSSYGESSSKSSTSTPSANAGATSTSKSSPAAASAYGAGAAASSSSSSSSEAVTVATKHAKLGTILAVGPKKMTVYLFEADRGTTSACSGTCASVWRPVTGTASVAGQAVAADLGTTTRSDGSKQVTYKGHPLYYYVKDKDNGDSYGQGSRSFGAGWYVLKPSGSKLDTGS